MSAHQKGFVFDLNKCTGCQACGIACKVENQTQLEMDWRQIYTFNGLRHPSLPLFHLSMACNHCVDPPCLRYCPALAYNKDASTGAVTIDPEKCIGCRYCSWNCPYDAPQFNVQKGVMEKCTFCNHRLVESLDPACVSACPTSALGVENHTNGGAVSVPGFTPAPIQPAIRLIPLRSGNRIPEAAFPAADAEMYSASLPEAKPRISARSEWTLVAFTLTAALLTALFAATVLGRIQADPLLFLCAGAAAMTLSTLHLGRGVRAYRAILNWRRSWLSREVLAFSAFMMFAAAYFFLPQARAAAGAAGLIAGGLLLISIDQVYRVMAVANNRALHSAQVTWTALFVAGILAGAPWLWIIAGAFKLALYLHRWIRTRNGSWILALLRISAGFVAPAMLAAKGAGMLPVLLCAAFGELIDRCEFYSGLELHSPALQMRKDTEAALRT